MLRLSVIIGTTIVSMLLGAMLLFATIAVGR